MQCGMENHNHNYHNFISWSTQFFLYATKIKQKAFSSVILYSWLFITSKVPESTLCWYMANKIRSSINRWYVLHVYTSTERFSKLVHYIWHVNIRCQKLWCRLCTSWFNCHHNVLSVDITRSLVYFNGKVCWIASGT